MEIIEDLLDRMGGTWAPDSLRGRRAPRNGRGAARLPARLLAPHDHASLAMTAFLFNFAQLVETAADGGGEMKQARILLIEDSPTFAKLVTILLKGCGYAVLREGTGADGLRAAREQL